MAALLWITTVLLIVHGTHSYILLTANMEDVHAVAKQMLSSPVVDQIGRIWRRATIQFNQKLKKPKVQKRVDEDLDSDTNEPVPGELGSGYLDNSFRHRSQRVLKDLAALGQNAGVYLKSLRRMFNDFTRE